MIVLNIFVFIEQKTAYEMRISDWSSDVCSSDLATSIPSHPAGPLDNRHGIAGPGRDHKEKVVGRLQVVRTIAFLIVMDHLQRSAVYDSYRVGTFARHI